MQYGDLVSVVVPVYNRAHLLERSIGSLIAQSYRNLDIVLADDCSTDDIEGAVAALGDDRVRLVRRAANGGAAAARNTGIAAARGELIAFHDSDDICTFDRIAQSVRALAALPGDHVGVYGMLLFYTDTDEAGYGAVVTDVRPRPHIRPLSGDLSRVTLEANTMNLPTILVKKAAVLAAGGFDEALRQNVDWDLCLRLTRQGRFGFVPEPFVLTPTSLDPQVSAARVSRSARQGARSFVRITGKLKRAGIDGRILARHYATTALYLLRIGRPRFARRYLRRALALAPARPRLWAHLALSHAPGLHARLRRPEKV